MQLTSKEKDLILDNLTAEELCIQKYEMYANNAEDQDLTDLFNYLADQEKQHAQTLNDMLNGNLESFQNKGQSQNQNNTQQNHNVEITNQNSTQEIVNQAISTKDAEEYGGFSDRQLLQDALMTEKHVSSSYDTSVLESANPEIRQAFEHIQQEEHQHAQDLFDMMNQKGWYTVNPATPPE